VARGKDDEPGGGRKRCGKPVAGSTCTLLKYHKGECIRPIGRAVVPARAGGLPSPDILDERQVADILDRAELFKDWLDAVKIHALELMQKGKRVAGFKAVAKQTRYAWNSDLDAKKIAKKLGLTVEQITETKLKSASKVKAIAGTKKHKLIAGMTFRPFAVTVARENDRRQEIPSTKISFQPVHPHEDEDDD
jgi:hypothetical protein